jgi:hypothetical protein
MEEAMEETHQDQPLPGHGGAETAKAETDFDRSEPHALLIAGFGIASVIGLIVIILGIQAYFDHLREQAEYEKVAVPVAQDLKNLHSQEDEELNHYKYVDRNNGTVQIPISRAMQLIAQEAAAHKLKYFQKPTPVKVPEAPGAAPAAGAAGTGAAPPIAGAAGAPAGNGAPPQGGQGQPTTAGGTAGSSSATGSAGKK